MATLQNANGSIIQATGRLEARLLAEGWTPTDQPAQPGLSLVTAAALEQLATTVINAVAVSAADRANLREILEPIADELPVVAAEVDDLVATVEATTTAAAPKPTPRTDALEAWRGEAEPIIDALPANPVAGNDPRLTDARTPTAHTHPAAQVTGLHTVATSGAYNDLTGKPALHAVATSGDYNALSNKPTIPTVKRSEGVTVNSGALTANTVKNVTATWPTAMPDANYRVGAISHSATPQNIAIGIVSKSTTNCVLAVRSTAAINANPGLNIDVTALA